MQAGRQAGTPVTSAIIRIDQSMASSETKRKKDREMNAIQWIDIDSALCVDGQSSERKRIGSKQVRRLIDR